MSREVLDLFSAACGGWSLGLHRAGFRTVAACEVMPWRRALYSQNNPGVKVYDDVRTLTAERLRGDLGRLPRYVVGSPPCQDISSANTKGKGVEGERSGLYFEAVRIIGEVRPRWFALENSANLRTRGADAVLSAMEGLGYSCWPFVVSAGDVGANHERKRSWLIGCDLEQVTNGDIDPVWESVLSERSIPQAAFAGDFAAHPNRDGEHAPSLDGEMGELRRMVGDRGREVADPDGIGQVGFSGRGIGGDACVSPDSGHAAQDGCRSRISRGRAGADTRAEQPACGDDCERNTPHPDQARQAHGCMVSGLRQAEIADYGCCSGRRDDEPRTGQMGLRARDCGNPFGGRSDWSLADLADRVRMDDGLPARMADIRVSTGDGKRQSAASLIVEAYGDSVVPQIPEAIGRAILRTERALTAVYGAAA